MTFSSLMPTRWDSYNYLCGDLVNLISFYNWDKAPHSFHFAHDLHIVCRFAESHFKSMWFLLCHKHSQTHRLIQDQNWLSHFDSAFCRCSSIRNLVFESDVLRIKTWEHLSDFSVRRFSSQSLVRIAILTHFYWDLFFFQKISFNPIIFCVKSY